MEECVEAISLELNPCHLYVYLIKLNSRLMSRSLLEIRPLVEGDNLELNPCHLHIELVDLVRLVEATDLELNPCHFYIEFYL